VSVRLVGTTNPQQIEVMEFELIVDVFGDGDYSRLDEASLKAS